MFGSLGHSAHDLKMPDQLSSLSRAKAGRFPKVLFGVIFVGAFCTGSGGGLCAIGLRGGLIRVQVAAVEDLVEVAGLELVCLFDGSLRGVGEVGSSCALDVVENPVVEADLCREGSAVAVPDIEFNASPQEQLAEASPHLARMRIHF